MCQIMPAACGDRRCWHQHRQAPQPAPAARRCPLNWACLDLWQTGRAPWWRRLPFAAKTDRSGKVARSLPLPAETSGRRAPCTCIWAWMVEWQLKHQLQRQLLPRLCRIPPHCTATSHHHLAQIRLTSGRRQQRANKTRRRRNASGRRETGEPAAVACPPPAPAAAPAHCLPPSCCRSRRKGTEPWRRPALTWVHVGGGRWSGRSF